MPRNDLWEEPAEFTEIAAEFRTHPLVLSMKNYIQHGVTTTYEHVESVAKTAYRMAKRQNGIDVRTVVRAAFLHDFYLYDWHIPDPVHPHRLHGYHHPQRAAENAKREFPLSGKEYSMIRTHMWPLIFFRFPKSREAWILTVADKYCSLRETLHRKGETK